jgi:hypothetical protein
LGKEDIAGLISLARFINKKFSLLSGQSLNKSSCLSPITHAELSADWKTTDSIEVFSNTVTEDTCINV